MTTVASKTPAPLRSPILRISAFLVGFRVFFLLLHTTLVPLQTVIAEWPYAQQGPVLAQKINHLQALRLRAAPEWLPVIDAYMQTLVQYVQRRESRGRPGSHKQELNTNSKVAVTEALKRLDELENSRPPTPARTSAQVR